MLYLNVLHSTKDVCVMLYTTWASHRRDGFVGEKYTSPFVRGDKLLFDKKRVALGELVDKILLLSVRIPSLTQFIRVFCFFTKR